MAINSLLPLASARQTSDSYLRDKILNASQSELALMSYDEVLRSLRRAEHLSEATSPDYREKMDNIAQFGHMIVRAQAIIADLNSVLNSEAGSSEQEKKQVAAMADLLGSQYLYLNQHLALAHNRQSAKMIQQAIAIVQNWRDGWAGAMEKINESAETRTV